MTKDFLPFMLPIILAYALGFIWGKMKDDTFLQGLVRFLTIAGVITGMLASVHYR
jgi:hypothetical protein